MRRRKNGLFSRVIVTGVSGLLGFAFYRALQETAGSIYGIWHKTPFSRKETVEGADLSLDLERFDHLDAFLTETDCSLVVNCAAWPDIAPCESDPDGAKRINADLPAFLASHCRRSGAVLLHISTEQVFDGATGGYSETSLPAPVHVYGKTKAAGESSVLELDPSAVIARIPLVYGRSWTGVRSASEMLVQTVQQEDQVTLFTNEYRSPVLVDDVARAGLHLVESGFSGLVQVAGPERLSRMEFGLAVARRFGLDETKLVPRLSGGLSERPGRPLDLSLDTTLARSILPFPLKSVEDGLAQGV